MDRRAFTLFVAVALAVFGVDQLLKLAILEGFRVDGECISIILVYNKGVAFSMFAFLGEYLKYIQIGLLAVVVGFLLRERSLALHIPAAILLGAGAGNVYDRFMHEGVVDYIYWHCGFEFAVFNFADVMINVAVALIILLYLRENKRAKG